jgi:hypothetical protein
MRIPTLEVLFINRTDDPNLALQRTAGLRNIKRQYHDQVLSSKSYRR